MMRNILEGTTKIIAGPSKGQNCHFPFEYKGKNHSKCISDDSHGWPWCASKSKYSAGSFGYCDCPDTNDGRIYFFVKIRLSFQINVNNKIFYIIYNKSFYIIQNG